MEKKKGLVQTMVGPYGSQNRDQFLRFVLFFVFFFVLAFLVNFGQYTGMKLWSNIEEMKKK